MFTLSEGQRYELNGTIYEATFNHSMKLWVLQQLDDYRFLLVEEDGRLTDLQFDGGTSTFQRGQPTGLRVDILVPYSGRASYQQWKETAPEHRKSFRPNISLANCAILAVGVMLAWGGGAIAHLSSQDTSGLYQPYLPLYVIVYSIGAFIHGIVTGTVYILTVGALQLVFHWAGKQGWRSTIASVVIALVVTAILIYRLLESGQW